MPLDERLVKALDHWVGRHLERSGTDGSDLGEASRALLGPLFAERHAVFEKKRAEFVEQMEIAVRLLCPKARPR